MNQPTAVRIPWTLLALGLILLTAGALRFVNLRDVPPGLWFDEALNAQDAWAVWQPGGHFKLVYPDEFPREPLYETLLACVVRLAGPSVPAMRALSATIGTLTVLLLFLFLRDAARDAAELGDHERRLWPLAAAGVLATLRWHVIFSHLIFRTLILGPWMIGVVWAALALRRSLRTQAESFNRTAGRAALLGALIGGGFYTYLAWYFLLPAVALVTLASLAAGLRRPAPDVPGRGGRRVVFVAALILLFSAMVAAPLGAHYLRHRRDLLDRPTAVSVFAQGREAGWREIRKNAGEALLMFHGRGDHVPKHNIPHRPALDSVQGVLFILGLFFCGRALAHRRDPLAAALLAWLVCAVAATVFTHTDSPNFLRTLCVTPAVAAIAGLGLAGTAGALARVLGNRPERSGLVRSFPAIWMALALGASAFWTARDVQAWARRPDVWEAFHGNLRQLAEFARAADDAPVYIPRLLTEHRSFAFQTLGLRNIRPYEDWPTLLGPAPASGGRRLIVVTAMDGLYEPLRQLLPQASVVQNFRAPAGNTWAAAFAVPDSALPPPAALEELQRAWRRPMNY